METEEYQSSKDSNCVLIVAGRIALEATEDKIIIQLDPFRSGYECKNCNETGIYIKCVGCDNTGLNKMGRVCRECEGNYADFINKTCRTCKGSGTTLAIPESAKALPTSGRIVSAGNACKARKVGERVLFGAHTGYFLPFKGNIKLRIMREHEIMCRIYALEENIILGDFMVLEEDGNFRS